MRVLLKGQQFGHARAQHHPVARLQHHIGQQPPQRGIAAQHVDEPHATALEKPHIARVLADQVAVLGQRQFGEELHLAPVRQQGGHRVAGGKQPGRDEPQVEHPPASDENRQRRDLEDGEGREAIGARNTVHQQVGGCADERQRAAEDRRIGERYEQLRGGHAEGAGDLDHDRDHHHHYRRVVDEGGGEHDEADQCHNRQLRLVLGLTQRDLGEPVERSGPHQRTHDQKHHGDGPGRRIGQHPARFVIGKYPRHQHGRGAEHGHHFRRKALAQEQQEHDGDDQKRSQRLSGRAKADQIHMRTVVDLVPTLPPGGRGASFQSAEEHRAGLVRRGAVRRGSG